MTDRIFVTGAAGLIGRNLVSRLTRDGHHVVCFDLGEQLSRNRAFFESLRASGTGTVVAGTIMDQIAVMNAMRGAKTVYHLAAMLGVKRTEDNRLRCLDINIRGSENVLSACVVNDVQHVVLASSSEVYGEPASNPISESHDTKGKTVYAVSKLAAEEMVKGYHQIDNELNYTIVRFFNTYGEGQVAQFVITRFVKQVLDGQNPTVYGAGTQLRSYCHVEDAVDGLVRIMVNPVARQKTYNIGNSSQVFSLHDLAQKVIDTLRPGSGLSVDLLHDFVQADRSPSREIHTRYCNTSLAETELGFSARVTVEEGIRRLAAATEIHSDWPFEA